MFSNILQEAPEIKEGDTLVFHVTSWYRRVLSEALSCPRPIQVFFIIPAGESGIACLLNQVLLEEMLSLRVVFQPV